MIKRKTDKYIPIMLVILLFYVFIAFCVPYCHDDWDWGLDIGLDRFLHATLNSRYAGNFFVIVMTRSEIVKTAVIALTMFLIPLLVSKLCDGQRSLAKYLAANVLMLIVPKLMWQQTFGWVSAFANYVVPMALTFYLIIMMRRSVYGMRGRFWFLLPLAVIEGLFSENLTVYAFAVFLIFTIASAIKTKRLSAFHVFMTLFSLAGCAVMFSSSIYDTLLSSGSALGGIRVLAIDVHSGFANMVSEAFTRFFTLIFPGMFFDYPAITVAASLAVIVSALRSGPRWLAVVFTVPTAALNVLICLGMNSGAYLWAVPSALFICLLVLIIIGKRKTGLSLFFLFSAPAVLLPLVVTTELGPRLYFMPYMFLLAMTVTALPPIAEKRMTAAVIIPALALFGCIAFYGYIYTEIRCVTVDRAQAIEDAIESGSSQVVMRKDIYDYWWGRDSGSERMEYFKEFFGIPDNITVTFEQ